MSNSKENTGPKRPGPKKKREGKGVNSCQSRLSTIITEVGKEEAFGMWEMDELK